MSPASKPFTPALPLLALTMGEPAGIGPDITLTAWAMRAARAIPPFVFVGCADVLRHRARCLGMAAVIVDVGSAAEAADVFSNALPVLMPPVEAAHTPALPGQPQHAPSAPAVPRPGHPDPVTAALTIAAIAHAVALAQRGHVGGIVTNPIAKSVLYAAGFAHPGHTEYLAELAARHVGRPLRPVMMIASDLLRVVPLTIHLPLSRVPASLTPALIIETARITHAGLQQDFGIAHPRIAVSGLNPHAGESGTIGDEEVRIIAPAIAALRAEGLDVTGPHAADTLFHATARARYDVAIGMYHDQVLVPAKTLSFDTGVNITLGLPFVRTSPDHGTAFDIAGTGRASPESLIAALVLAGQMANRRRSARADALAIGDAS